MPAEVLGQRRLNRALLARQLLLERSELGLAEAVEQVGGLQTQYAPSGYIGLWSRLREFGRPMLTRALEERRLVQATIMRATIHTVSAADYWPLTIAVRRTRRQWFERVTRRDVASLDMGAAADAVRDELAGGPLKMSELESRLEKRGFPRQAAGWAGIYVDLVRVPPSGTWERRRADLYGLADDWLPEARGLGEEDGLEVVVRRYLGAFGPAPLADVANWAGLPPALLRPAVERLETVSFRDERGRELLDLPGLPLPADDTPAPVRFIATWDAMLLAHARRTGVLPEEYRNLVFNTRTPQSMPTFTVDGQVAGSWRYENGELQLRPFAGLAAAAKRDLEEEAHRLATFHSET